MGVGGKWSSKKNGEAELGERFIGTGTRKKGAAVWESMLEFKQCPETETWSSSTTGSLGNCFSSLVCFTGFTVSIVTSVSTRKREFRPCKRRKSQGVEMGGRTFACSEREQDHVLEPGLNWSCCFIRAWMKHLASEQDDCFLNHLFFVDLAAVEVFCTLKCAF